VPPMSQPPLSQPPLRVGNRFFTFLLISIGLVFLTFGILLTTAMVLGMELPLLLPGAMRGNKVHADDISYTYTIISAVFTDAVTIFIFVYVVFPSILWIEFGEQLRCRKFWKTYSCDWSAVKGVVVRTKQNNYELQVNLADGKSWVVPLTHGKKLQVEYWLTEANLPFQKEKTDTYD
jgi:hypothetical protein